MNSTKNCTHIKWPKIATERKLYIQRKCSLPVQSQISRQNISPQKNLEINVLASYPVIDYKRSPQILNEEKQDQRSLEKKTSAFLKKYNEKLKKQRKRQNKRKSQMNSRFMNTSRENQFFPFAPLSPSEASSQILVFKKSSLLDTFHSNFFQRKKDYTKDTKFQMLLKQISEIKKQEQKQVEKLHAQRFATLDLMKHKEKYNKQKRLTKYKNGFELPFRKKLSNDSPNQKYQSLKDTINILQKENIQERNKRAKSKNKKERQFFEKYYNFKKLDPWQNAKQINSMVASVEFQKHFQ